MKIRRITSVRTSIVGKYEVVVTLSDGSKLDDVISMEVDWPSAGGPMITLKMLGDDKLEIEPPQKCEHDWQQIAIADSTRASSTFRCLYCGTTEIRTVSCYHRWSQIATPWSYKKTVQCVYCGELRHPEDCKHVYEYGRGQIGVIGASRRHCRECGEPEKCPHKWMNTDLPKEDGSHIAKCIHCGVHR